VVDVGVGVIEAPVRAIRGEILLHVFVDFFLEVDAERAVGADDFVRADARVGGDVTVGIRDADVGGIVADDVIGAFNGGGGEFLEEGLFREFCGVVCLRRGGCFCGKRIDCG